MRWFTSDHHFGHRNILTYCAATRPFPDLDEMHAQLVYRWNLRVSPEDEVIVVGDLIASRRFAESVGSGILPLLNGRKTLVRGNHDPHDGVFLGGGFDAVVDHLVLDDGVLVIHRPCAPDFGPECELARRLDPTLVIHGHTHNQGPERPRHLNVCVDRWDLYPVGQDEVDRRLQQATTEVAEWSARMAPRGRTTKGRDGDMAKRTRAQETMTGTCGDACSCTTTWDTTGPDDCQPGSGEECEVIREGALVDRGDECCGTGNCRHCEGVA